MKNLLIAATILFSSLSTAYASVDLDGIDTPANTKSYYFLAKVKVKGIITGKILIVSSAAKCVQTGEDYKLAIKALDNPDIKVSITCQPNRTGRPIGWKATALPGIFN